MDFDVKASEMLPDLCECFGYESDQGGTYPAYKTIDREEASRIISQALRDVQRETALECIKIGHECVENWGKVTMHHLESAIRERFGLKEEP